jgi:hypothetical protein
MAWHGDPNRRLTLGRQAESEFDQLFACRCGGEFVKNDAANPYAPDRKCNRCGFVVDVKFCKDAMSYSAVTISQPAFDHYDDGVYIIAKFGDEWWGRRVEFLRHDRGPVSPPSHGGKYATAYYKFARSLFFPATNYLRQRE